MKSFPSKADSDNRQSKIQNLKLVGVVTCFIAFMVGWAVAHAQAPFYQGKTIRLIISTNPGGTGDLRIKATMPYLTKYIPGNPNIVAQYVAGAGGRTAANQIYKSVKPDGLTIANLGASMVTNAVMGAGGVEYDVDKFIYLGSPDSIVHWVFATRKEAGLNTIEKLRSASGLRTGAQSVGHTIYITGRLFVWVLGIKEPKFVVGYTGPEIDIALLRGEVDARAHLADTVFQRNADWLDEGVVDFHTIVEVPKGNKHPCFAHLPELESFACRRADSEGSPRRRGGRRGKSFLLRKYSELCVLGVSAVKNGFGYCTAEARRTRRKGFFIKKYCELCASVVKIAAQKSSRFQSAGPLSCLGFRILNLCV